MFSQILLMILWQNGGYQSSGFLKEHTTEILKNRLLHRNMYIINIQFSEKK